MPFYLSNLSASSLFISLSCCLILFSLIAIIIMRRFKVLRPEYKDDPILGNIGTLIGTIYGVLVGLTALYLVNNINYTTEAVQHEANAVADIYRDTQWLKDPQRTDIQTFIKTYIVRVTQQEWGLMKDGLQVTTHGDLIIDEITNSLLSYQTQTNAESLLIHDMLDAIRELYNARQQRLHMSRTQLNPEMWLVIIVGTILTLAINFLFRMKFYLHAAVVSATALMVASMIFLLISLERPFQGSFVVEPEAFQGVLSLMELRSQNALNVKPEGTAQQQTQTPKPGF